MQLLKLKHFFFATNQNSIFVSRMHEISEIFSETQKQKVNFFLVPNFQYNFFSCEKNFKTVSSEKNQNLNIYFKLVMAFKTCMGNKRFKLKTLYIIFGNTAE